MTITCVNGTLNDAKYTAPVPIIGLYIASTTFVCLLLMLFDLLSAYRHRRRWIPCRLFSLNSVTLTLLSVVTKLPVDLTTQMPSVQDQLSKLTGTTFICISMGILHPSIGDNRTSECFSNMASLSILIITIMANICIQISTGVIYLFIKAHIGIMCFMFLLLLLLWSTALDINNIKEYAHDYNKNRIITAPGSMLQRLRLCYLHGFMANPQLKICRDTNNFSIAGCCMICFSILAYCTYQSVIVKRLIFCGGVSDYNWSIWVTVAIQIITVSVGCFIACFRASFIEVLRSATEGNWVIGITCDLYGRQRVLRAHFCAICGFYLTQLLRIMNFVTFFLMMIPVMCVTTVVRYLCCGFNPENEKDVREVNRQMCIADNDSDAWVIWKAASDMNRWSEVSSSKHPTNLSQFVARTNPSAQLLTVDMRYPTILSMAVLVKVARLCIPYNLSRTLEDTLREAYEVIEYIDSRIKQVSLENKTTFRLARAVLMGDGFGFYLPEIIKRSTDSADFQSLSTLHRASVIINKLDEIMYKDSEFLSCEVRSIRQMIGGRQYETIEDLYNVMEQIFVNKLNSILAQLPNAIVKEVTESTAEEFEDRVRLALKILSKMKVLEAHVQWSFPVRGNISSLINTPDAQERDNNNVSDSLRVAVGENVPLIHDSDVVTLQVE